MAIARSSSRALDAPASELVDEMVARYVDWRECAARVSVAYRRCSPAATPHHSARLEAYENHTAALEHEEEAAIRYALAVERLERWLHRASSAQVAERRARTNRERRPLL
jgi:hypothetical protein